MKWIVVLLTLLCLYQWKKMQTKATANGCLPGWTRYLKTDRCFYISSNYDTYENAKKFCASRKSELAPPITCDAQMVLNAFLVAVRRKCKARQNCEEFWIGIDNSSKTIWKTTKGLDIQTSGQCQRWAGYYPKGDGRCVVMSYQDYRKRGTWQNTDCDKELRYVCMSCPNDFYYMPEINECLFMNKHWMNWSLAQAACGKLKPGAGLLTIKTSLKQEAVARFLHITPRNGCRKYRWTQQEELFWTGGQTKDAYKCKDPYFWKPVKGVAMPINYGHWYPGLPNCGYRFENCVVVSSSQRLNYQWDDLMCDTAWCSICEF